MLMHKLFASIVCVASLVVSVPADALTLNGREVQTAHYKAFDKPTPDLLAVLSVGNETNANWEPQSGRDLAVTWPQEWREVNKQDFSAYTFALNAATMKGETFRTGLIPRVYYDIVAYLDEAAEAHTETVGVTYHQVNRFAYEYTPQMTLPNPHRGAFSNAYTAIGYLHLYDTFSTRAVFREKAKKYIYGIVNAAAPEPLWYLDPEGYLWFEEITAGAGAEQKRAGVFNGHIAAVFALKYYRDRFNAKDLDPWIEAGITTMERYLPMQRRPVGTSGAPFGYSMDNLDNPDYGPQRAVNYVNKLCEMTADEDICDEAKAFQAALKAPH